MHKRSVAGVAALVALLAASACGTGTAEPAARAVNANTSPSTSPSSPSSPSASPSAEPSSPSGEPVRRFGETYAFGDGSGTVTVYTYKHNATQFGETSDATTVYSVLDIKFCLKHFSKGITRVEISGNPWSLKFGDGLYNSTGSTGGSAMKPEYPEGKAVKVGTCVRGWLDFEVPKNGKLAEVQYEVQDSPGGPSTIITWKP